MPSVGPLGHAFRDDVGLRRDARARVFGSPMSIQGFHLMNSIDSRAALTASLDAPATVRNARLLDWVRGIADLTRPDRIVWCDGS